MTIPEGYELLKNESPFVRHNGPFYFKEEGSTVAIGLMVADRHCNSDGSIHGGLVATMADLVLGTNVGIASTPLEVIEKYRSDGIVPSPSDLPKLVTASLAIDYLGRAESGDWLEIRADIHKIGKSLSFASAHMARDGEQITRANGVFRDLRRQI